MRFADREVFLSPSDLVKFQGCTHSTALDRRYAEYGQASGLIADEGAAEAEIIKQKGIEHERAYLATLEAMLHSDVVTIAEKQRFGIARSQTLAAMKAGPKVIYQGALENERWQGYADFLERVEEPSALGAWSYEPTDTKLKRRVDAKHAVQLAVYGAALGAMQGRPPRHAHVVLGTMARESFRLDDVKHYVARAMRRLEAFVAPGSETSSTTPEPCAACGQCRWGKTCADEWEANESVSLVAGITSAQRERLATAGIATVGGLASAITAPAGLAASTFSKLKTQASLQAARRAGGEPRYELRPADPGRGFDRLPKPHAQDLFFDMEGDPLYEDGLEYLFGLHHAPRDGRDFTAWWAHDQAQERDVAAQVIAHLHEHCRVHPDSYIYHYNHYEVTALRRLAMRYSVGEGMLDDLLRGERFVDLYRIVAQGLVCSEPGYSLKDLEVFYQPPREGEVKSAGASIAAYEHWRVSKDQGILDGIENYNADDCRSTRGLRDWLLRLRPATATWFAPGRPEEESGVEKDAAQAALRRVFDAAAPRIGAERADLLFHLTQFHARAQKPQWWAYFDKQAQDEEAMVADLECLGGLQATGAAHGKGERLRTYRFPPQETKLRERKTATAANLGSSTTIVAFDRAKGEATLSFPIPKEREPIVPPDRLDLTPNRPFDDDILRDATLAVVSRIVEDPESPSAAGDLIARQPPRLMGREAGARIARSDDMVHELTDAALALDHSCLAVQGPPGTGKTYASSHAILALVRAGKRVGVMSNAHKAIDNLLTAVEARAAESGLEVSVIKRDSERSNEDSAFERTTNRNDKRLFSSSVVGGTAWHFARPDVAGTFDHLFVDEAGQVSLANALTASHAAKNLILVGDPMQLPQPVQGVHPGDSGLSCLDYFLKGERVVPPERGLFLPVSRRMHPAVCTLVSRFAYDGKLSSDPATARQSLTGMPAQLGLPPSGVRFLPVDHEGNGQTSEEEAYRIAALHSDLLRADFVDKNGRRRRLGIEDVLVVAPYNAQVNLIESLLPAGSRVGTVDRFQGQEAPVCLVSLTTSSSEELPRDIAFLFSVNRLNVAISRAQALAVIVASPRLLDTPCDTLDQIRLVNGLCLIADYEPTLQLQ